MNGATSRLRVGLIKRIHVDQHRIKARDPRPLTVQTSRGSVKAARIVVNGPSEIVYRPEHPLNCGARVWIETHAAVDLFDVAEAPEDTATCERTI